MTATAELVGKVQGVEAAINDGRTNADKALQRATLLTEQAAAHGWVGMVGSMQGAADALEQTIANFGRAGDAIGEALSALDAITEQMSQQQVTERLEQAITHLNSSQTALDAVTGSLDDARRAAEQAGSPEELMAMLQGVEDDTDDARRAVHDTKTATESERHEAVNWGN